MGLIDDIKNQVKRSGNNKSKFVYFKAEQKVRVRFLTDMDAGAKLAFHDSFALSINLPCQEVFGRECPYCNDDELRTRDQYSWSVWDYEAKEVKLILAPVNNASPIPGLVAMYEAYGTLTDRDYVITKNGTGPTTTYSVVPMDKAKFRNDKAKPYSEDKFLALVDKAFPSDIEDEDEKPAAKKKSGTTKQKARPVEVDDDDEAVGHEALSAKELYALCKEREIDVKPRQTKDFYLDQLSKADNEDGEWDEVDEWDS